MNDHIREKIAAMLAKTEANGATEDEAIAAAKLARKLMRQYGITVEDIAERKETVTDFVIAKSSTGVYKHVMDRFLAHAIGEFTETRAVVVKQKGMKAKADGIERGETRRIIELHTVDGVSVNTFCAVGLCLGAQVLMLAVIVFVCLHHAYGREAGIVERTMMAATTETI